MLWITSPFVVKLSDVSPLRKPLCQSNICSKILSCSELPCFQKAVTPAENLSQEILQGQGLIRQQTKCHPRGAIAMKTLTGVSPDVLEDCCFPKSQNRTSLFCSAEYYFAVNFICFPLYQKCWCFWIFIFFFTGCVFQKQSVGRDFTSSRAGQRVPWRCVQLLSIIPRVSLTLDWDSIVYKGVCPYQSC